MVSLVIIDHPLIALPAGWESLLIIISIYPFMTGMIGADPLYLLGHIRSCDSSDRNQCGTLPYQIAAAIDHIPGVCDSDTEHSLDACHPIDQPKPRHKVWHVD